MSDSLLDILLPRGDAGPERVYGVVIGIVTNNDDPDGLGRVKVRFPWLSDTDESWWARIAASRCRAPAATSPYAFRRARRASSMRPRAAARCGPSCR